MTENHARDSQVYAELRSIAESLMRRQASGHTLQATAVVHEAWMKLAKHDAERFESREHFMATAARAMRQILINHAERRSAQKRGGGRQRVTLDTSMTPTPDTDLDVLELDEALRALEALDARQARVVELRFFAGLTVDEVAGVLDIAPRTVQLDWRMARAWLSTRLLESDADGR